MRRVICLMGPTASGKTDLAVELVQRSNCEIISVDSAMVYKGLDIGTAKPDTEILTKAPHRLIDICDPAQPYSAGEFRRDAIAAIHDCFERGKTPLLVGGTMLYFRVLQQGLASLPPADTTLRMAIATQAQQNGWPALHAELASVDPIAAARIHEHDSQRIQRAIEVYRLTGKTITSWQETDTFAQSNYEFLNFGLIPDRHLLHARIAQRFERMLQAGLVEEVQNLYCRSDMHADLPAIRSVGYRQVWAFLAGELSLLDMKERAIIATRQLAKRQMTWLKPWPNINHIQSIDPLLRII